MDRPCGSGRCLNCKMDSPATQLSASDMVWVARLKSFNLWPHAVRESIVDRAIVNVECTPEEEANAWQQFCEQTKVDPEKLKAVEPNSIKMSLDDMRTLCRRLFRVEKFKDATWGKALPAYFLKRKTGLDHVLYSILRLRDAALAQELYLRIKEGEETFAHLAIHHSNGPESHSGGIIGPVALGTLPPELMKLLATSTAGQLRPPARIGEWVVITRVEKRWDAEFDDAIRRQLLQELFQLWLNGEIKRTLSPDEP